MLTNGDAEPLFDLTHVESAPSLIGFDFEVLDASGFTQLTFPSVGADALETFVNR